MTQQLTDPAGAQVATVQAMPVATPSHNAAFYATTSSSQCLAANTARTWALFVNISDAFVFLALGAAAVLNTGIPLAPNGGAYQMTMAEGNLYTGDVYAIHGGSGNKPLCISEGM